jgi:hypothetical protein
MMSDVHSHWIDQLSEYLDGTLDTDAKGALEAHLAECPECAQVLEELRGVVSTARAQGDLHPTRDLWPGIADRLGARPGERAAEVIPLPTGRTTAPPAGAGLTLSPRQLAAAAAVVALISAAATWTLGLGVVQRPVGAPLPMPAAVSPAATGVEAPPPGMADELTRLEAALNAARDRLDPETVRILEKNLDVIDRAIQDSRRALEADPGNPFLKEHLDRAYRQKVDYLREAAGIADWSG